MYEHSQADCLWPAAGKVKRSQDMTYEFIGVMVAWSFEKLETGFQNVSDWFHLIRFSLGPCVFITNESHSCHLGNHQYIDTVYLLIDIGIHRPLVVRVHSEKMKISIIATATIDPLQPLQKGTLETHESHRYQAAPHVAWLHYLFPVERCVACLRMFKT